MYRFTQVRVRVADARAAADQLGAAFGCVPGASGSDAHGRAFAGVDAGTDVALVFVEDPQAGDPSVPAIMDVGFDGPRIPPRGPEDLPTIAAPRALNEARHVADPYLQHVSCLVPDLERATRTFRDGFGLRTVFDFSKPGEGGFRLLADAAWDGNRHDFTVEPIAGPDFGPEQSWWDAHGAHWDHVCFVCGDVAGAYSRGLDHGMAPMLAPRDYEEFGLTIAWLYGPNNLHVELMSPVSDLGLREAFANGNPVNAWEDQQVRNVKWLPVPDIDG